MVHPVPADSISSIADMYFGWAAAIGFAIVMLGFGISLIASPFRVPRAQSFRDYTLEGIGFAAQVCYRHVWSGLILFLIPTIAIWVVFFYLAQLGVWIAHRTGFPFAAVDPASPIVLAINMGVHVIAQIYAYVIALRSCLKPDPSFPRC